MRPDMHEVVIERPRGGLRGPREGVRWDPRIHDPEMIPSRESTSRQRGGTKHLSDLLGPLQRFLNRSVGRPWDDVYSELRAGLSPDSLLHMHILEHVEQMVGLRWPGWGRWTICPKTGLLLHKRRDGWLLRDPGRGDMVTIRRFLLRRVDRPWAVVAAELTRAGGDPDRVGTLVRTDVVRVRRGARPGRIHRLLPATETTPRLVGAPLPHNAMYVEDGVLRLVR